MLSIASRKGLLAAAGPDAVIIATTESVRKAFEGPSNGNSNFKPFQPQLTLPMPMRISQLAFSSDETYLVLSAAEGGGLAVYDVHAILQGSTESAFQMSTNGQALRAVTPNPSPERGEFIAVVTNDGSLMMANLKERSFVAGANGQVLKDGVSCLSWSTQGKQLVAGLGNGSAIQMTPDGTVKAEIPVPPNLESGNHSKSFMTRSSIDANHRSLFYYMVGEQRLLVGSHPFQFRHQFPSDIRLPRRHQTAALKLHFSEDWGPCSAIWAQSVSSTPLPLALEKFPSKYSRLDYCCLHRIYGYWSLQQV